MPVFAFGTLMTIVMVEIHTHMGRLPLPVVIVVNVLLFTGLFSRMVPFQAAASSVPLANQRGSFNAINASIQQLCGGLASVLGGHIVSLGADGTLQSYSVLGDVVVGTALVAFVLMWQLQKDVRAREVPTRSESSVPPPAPA